MHGAYIIGLCILWDVLREMLVMDCCTLPRTAAQAIAAGEEGGCLQGLLAAGEEPVW